MLTRPFSFQFSGGWIALIAAVLVAIWANLQLAGIVAVMGVGQILIHRSQRRNR